MCLARHLALLLLLLLLLGTAIGAYSPSECGIRSNNSSRSYNNRPLYGDHNGALLMAGDLPYPRFASDPWVNGGLMLGLVRGNASQWFHAMDNLDACFSAGRMTWVVRGDGALGGLNVTLSAVPARVGMAVQLDARAATLAPGDRIVWAFGGITQAENSGNRPVGWALDALLTPAALLQRGFTPEDSRGNTLAQAPGAAAATMASGADGKRVVSISCTAGATLSSGSDHGATPTELLAHATPLGAAADPTRPSARALPVTAGLALRLDASELVAAGVADGARVGAWAPSAGSSGGASATAVQRDAGQQPMLLHDALAAGVPGVQFAGGANLAGNLSLGADKTIVVALRSTAVADACCGGIFTSWSAGDHGESSNGLDTKRAAGGGVCLAADWAGQNDFGLQDIANRLVVGSVSFNSTATRLQADGCDELSPQGQGGVAHAASLFNVGWRASDTSVGGRRFDGIVAELLVYNRSLADGELVAAQQYLAARWQTPARQPPLTCSSLFGPLAVGSFDPGQHSVVYWLAEVPPGGSGAAGDAAASFAAAEARASALGARLASRTPDAVLDASTPVVAAAVDGLYRSSPPGYVHGAMAWDVLYVGWRSQYGATVLGWGDNVAAEGVYMFGNQVQPGAKPNNTKCESDPAHMMTGEAPSSRLYGTGRIDHNAGMYDMQSMFFDQQQHMWRWTGNATHEPVLRAALKLHVQWADECFDADGNGLFHSYINTWPTDSVWYNGGESAEETAYVLRSKEALRDMAARAGDAAEAAAWQAALDAMRASFHATLWLPARGHPAAWREESGLRRLRPDAWLYAVFLPIDAGLLTPHQAAQALHYSEWGLERESVSCSVGGGSAADVCGERVWTSNWVPSIWSVREFWPGDNYALALAYFQAGQQDAGYAVLLGNLRHDMFNQSVPGALGAHNGGIDFNDVVHPMARALVEGLWGYAPNYPLGYVALAPRLPSSWRKGAFTAPDFALTFADDATAEQLEYTLRLTTPAPEIRLRLPVRACSVTAVVVEPAGGAAPEALTFSWSSAPGFGQGEVLVNVTGAGTATLVVRVAYAQPVPHVPAVALTVAGAVAGALVALPIFGAAGGAGVLAARGAVSDPQGMFAKPPTHNGTHVLGKLGAQSLGHMLLFVTLAGDAGASGAHALAQERMLKVFVTNQGGGGGTVVLRTADATAQQRRVRLPDFANASALPLSANEIDGAAAAVAEQPPADAAWLPANLSGALNGQLGAVYDKVYLSPRPATCSARIGTDGYSAWTFTYGQGNAPPVPDLALAPALLGADGLVVTPQGARFRVQGVSPGDGGGGGNNIAFVSQWDNYPASVTVPFPSPSGAGSKLWVLVAGTTNPMQTLLPNAELTATFDSGANATLQLTPPLNYWSMCAYGGADYDYGRDAFALPLQPPAAVQLGKDTRAMVYALDVPEGDAVASLTLTALSLEVVVGLLAASVEA